MKRNEMIKKMVHDTFNELQGANINTAEFPYRVAELMLAVCEKAGMRAPITTKTLSCGCCSDYIEDWEPEENFPPSGAV